MTPIEELTAAILAENTVFTPKILEMKTLPVDTTSVDWIQATIKTHKFGHFEIPEGWKPYTINIPKKQIIQIQFARYK